MTIRNRSYDFEHRRDPDQRRLASIRRGGRRPIRTRAARHLARRRARRAPLPDRAERLRQDDLAQRHRRAGGRNADPWPGEGRFGALEEKAGMLRGEDLRVLRAPTDKTMVLGTNSGGEPTFLADGAGVFSAPPGTIKEIIKIDEPHPRKP